MQLETFWAIVTLGRRMSFGKCVKFSRLQVLLCHLVSLDLQTAGRRITEVIQLCVMIFAILIELKQNFRVKCNRKLDSWDPA